MAVFRVDERRGICFDLEGPLSPEDFAYSLFMDTVKNGGSLYRVLSRYDDILALEINRPGYEPGDTLSLILPFLIANGLTISDLEQSARSYRRLMVGAHETIEHCRTHFDSVAIITTSYRPFASQISERLGIADHLLYCTELPASFSSIAPLSSFKTITRIQADLLEEFGNANLEDPSISELLVDRLDKLYLSALPSVGVPYPTTAVQPRGGTRKSDAIGAFADASSIRVSELVFVGDSITDVAAFRCVKDAGGLAVSFNGNRYAVTEASVSVAGHSLTDVIGVLDVWCEGGSEAVCTTFSSTSDVDTPGPIWLGDLGQSAIDRVIERDGAMRVEVRGEPGDLG